MKPITEKDLYDTDDGIFQQWDTGSVIGKERVAEFVKELKRRIIAEEKDFDILNCSDIIDIIDELAPLFKEVNE